MASGDQSIDERDEHLTIGAVEFLDLAEVMSALPALRELMSRLASSSGPSAQDELEKVQQIIDRRTV